MLTVPQYIFSNFHVQGPHKWYPLRGQVLKPRDPKPVDVFDKRGDQSGCNDWAALRRVEEELNERYWRDSPWVDHACDQCRKCTPIEGQNFFTQAAAIDGNTSGAYGHGSQTHTDFEAQPWWEVDLGLTSEVNTVSVIVSSPVDALRQSPIC